jgi:hypothetical protein
MRGRFVPPINVFRSPFHPGQSKDTPDVLWHFFVRRFPRVRTSPGCEQGDTRDSDEGSIGIAFVNPELVNRLQPTPYNRSTIDGGQSAHAAAAVHPRSASPPRNPKQFPEIDQTGYIKSRLAEARLWPPVPPTTSPGRSAWTIFWSAANPHYVGPRSAR